MYSDTPTPCFQVYPAKFCVCYIIRVSNSTKLLYHLQLVCLMWCFTCWFFDENVEHLLLLPLSWCVTLDGGQG